MTNQVDKPAATLSVDLDDLWSYQRTHGDASWMKFRSFLPKAIPRLLDLLKSSELVCTMFIVGKDAEFTPHRDVFMTIADEGHEIGNHSYAHDVDFHRAGKAALEKDFDRSEAAIEAATQKKPCGFRGPSFRLSRAILETLVERGYRYDASTLPTFIGPFAKAFHRATARLSAEEKRRQQGMFGVFAEGIRPLNPYRWDLADACLFEVPVTTVPIFRLPLHLTYVNFLADFSPALAVGYFRAAMRTCLAFGVTPSLLLHATDVIGRDDPEHPAFMPGMKRRNRDKNDFLGRILEWYTNTFDVMPLDRYVATLQNSGNNRVIIPNF